MTEEEAVALSAAIQTRSTNDKLGLMVVSTHADRTQHDSVPREQWDNWRVVVWDFMLWGSDPNNKIVFDQPEQWDEWLRHWRNRPTAWLESDRTTFIINALHRDERGWLRPERVRTYASVARELGISATRVRDIHHKAELMIGFGCDKPDWAVRRVCHQLAGILPPKK